MNRQDITNEIVKAMEKGVCPWKQSWGNTHTKICSIENAYAELSACFLCRACNIPNDLENHESYIASWITCMKNDVSYIWKASRDASKITDYFLKLAGVVEENEIEMEENDVTE